MTNTPEEQKTEDRILSAVSASMSRPNSQETQSSSLSSRNLTIGQGILGSIATLISFIAMAHGYTTAVQGQIEEGRERMVKVEYQNQVSIIDRAELHVSLSSTNNTINEINTHLARMDTTLQGMADRQNRTAK